MCNRNNCFPCRFFVRATALTSSETDIVIDIPEMTVFNLQRVCLFNPFEIPVSATPLPVVVAVGSSANLFHLVDKRGNHIYSDQIGQNELIPLEAATDSMLMVHQGYCLRDSAVNYPNILPAETRGRSYNVETEQGGDK